MEAVPGSKPEISIEQYEELLDVKLTDVTGNELREPGKFFVFAVTPNFTIFISKTSHYFLAEKHGVDLDSTLTEGNIIIHKDGTSEILLKNDRYQPIPGFRGTSRELHLFKQGVKSKLESFLK